MSKLINGRTQEEIKYALGCGADAECDNCAYCSLDFETMVHGFCCNKVVKDALALIEHLEAQQPKWISVKERLPEQGSDVLIRIERDPEVVYYAAAIRNERSRLFDCWDTNDEDFNCGFGHPRVTHWMPLPEPPEETNV